MQIRVLNSELHQKNGPRHTAKPSAKCVQRHAHKSRAPASANRRVLGAGNLRSMPLGRVPTGRNLKQSPNKIVPPHSHVIPHHIISYHLTLRQITSHHLTSHPIRITSHHVTSRHITSHHITSHNCGQHWLYTMCIREALQCQEAAPKTRSEMSAAKPPAHHTRLADAPWAQPGAAERREAK